jgi:hypothetical protein
MGFQVMAVQVTGVQVIGVQVIGVQVGVQVMGFNSGNGHLALGKMGEPKPRRLRTSTAPGSYNPQPSWSHLHRASLIPLQGVKDGGKTIS